MQRILFIAVCLMFVGAVVAKSQSPPTREAEGGAAKTVRPADPAEPKNKTPKDKPLVVTPEREAAVMAFVQQHHTELGDLLGSLKRTNRKEYERAVRELFRASEHLAQVQERDAGRHAIELKLWRVKSRIQLLAARIQMGGSEEMRSELKNALIEQFDLQASLLDRERTQLADRVEKLQRQIEQLKATRESAVESQFRLLTKVPNAAETAKAGELRSGKQLDKKTPVGDNAPPSKPAEKTSLP